MLLIKSGTANSHLECFLQDKTHTPSNSWMKASVAPKQDQADNVIIQHLFNKANRMMIKTNKQLREYHFNHTRLSLKDYQKKLRTQTIECIFQMSFHLLKGHPNFEMHKDKEDNICTLAGVLVLFMQTSKIRQ